jgi:nicotinamidase-related amidase
MTQQVSETLNPNNAALLLIDHQVGTMNFGISDLSALELKNQTLLLAEAARAFGLPVVLTASNPTDRTAPFSPSSSLRCPRSQ